MPHPVVHFEIAGRDGEALERFYAELFGWEISVTSAGGHRYAYVDTGAEEAVRGGIRHEPEGSAEIVLYVRVEDLEAMVQTAESAGATVRIPPMESGELRFAVIADPAGNPIGLLERDRPG